MGFLNMIFKGFNKASEVVRKATKVIIREVRNPETKVVTKGFVDKVKDIVEEVVDPKEYITLTDLIGKEKMLDLKSKLAVRTRLNIYKEFDKLSPDEINKTLEFMDDNSLRVDSKKSVEILYNVAIAAPNRDRLTLLDLVYIDAQPKHLRDDAKTLLATSPSLSNKADIDRFEHNMASLEYKRKRQKPVPLPEVFGKFDEGNTSHTYIANMIVIRRCFDGLPERALKSNRPYYSRVTMNYVKKEASGTVRSQEIRGFHSNEVPTASYITSLYFIDQTTGEKWTSPSEAEAKYGIEHIRRVLYEIDKEANPPILVEVFNTPHTIY